jgi:hypothetical protein
MMRFASPAEYIGADTVTHAATAMALDGGRGSLAPDRRGAAGE